MLLLERAIDVKVLRAGVLVFRAREQKIGKIVVDLDLERALDIGSQEFASRAGISTRLPRPSLPTAVLNLGGAEVEGELDRFAVLHQNVAAAGARLGPE